MFQLQLKFGKAYSQVGMNGHPSAQARALVTLGNSGRFFVGCISRTDFSLEGAQKNSPERGVWGGRGSGFIYIYIYIYISYQPICYFQAC